MGQRPIAENVRCDRRTVRPYVDAAVAAGLARDGGENQLTDQLIRVVVEAARPDRPSGHGAAGTRAPASTTGSKRGSRTTG